MRSIEDESRTMIKKGVELNYEVLEAEERLKEAEYELRATEERLSSAKGELNHKKVQLLLRNYRDSCEIQRLKERYYHMKLATHNLLEL